MTEPLFFAKPFDTTFVTELSTLTHTIFGDFDVADLAWRLAEMPDASVHAIAVDGHLVAFKFG